MMENSKQNFWKEVGSYIVMIAAVFVVVLFVNNFLLINARIPSSSMEDTIMMNDRIFGNRLSYHSEDPKRFDIVIFRYPDDGSAEPLDDSFCREEPLGDYGPFTVPEGCYFMMGDNRNNSNDSRFWHNKYVAKDAILGKAVLRYWPFSKFGTVK